ncbi:MAG: alpha-ketoglutarate-dependent dioxygenase AlkB [Alphaproteobacteria bacterium]|nr:alpha-ketoglutarate-dependent dioxygenase AlkB [Alphaproteobacteria bacterium]
MSGFQRFSVDLAGAPGFEALLESAGFEAVTAGRAGNHLSKPGPRGYPIVRTTTAYARPQALWSALHEALAGRVLQAAAAGGLELPEQAFNHALIELYDDRYRKMGYHSDQALDLAEGSHVAILSLYDRDPGAAPRQLLIQHKQSGARQQLALEHGSVVLFSLACNAEHRHKIVLPALPAAPTRWLGLTLRRSATFVRQQGGRAVLEHGAPLRLADAAERAAFLRLRGQENRERDFRYPPLDLTLSPGDLLPPGP